MTGFLPVIAGEGWASGSRTSGYTLVAGRIGESSDDGAPLILHQGSGTTDDPDRDDPSAAEARLDAALVDRVGRGDRAALAELYDRHSTRAYSLACHFVGPTAAMDVVHDSFITLLVKPGSFDPSRGRFRGWFLTSVHHRCLNLRRAQRPTEGDEALAERPGHEPDPADAVVDRLRDAKVRAALLALGHDQREVLVLAYYGGLTQSALSARLGVPLGTVKARMRRGLLVLRGALRGEAFDEETEEMA